ncbi:MAG: amidohydrolase family protein, partial [Thermoanaerobaculia bacterium]
FIAAVASLLTLLPAGASAQSQPDPALLAAIRAIRAVDNHSHLPTAAAGSPDDSLKDSLGTTPFSYPVRLRVDNPDWMRSWRALYDEKPGGMSVKAVAEVVRRKHALMTTRGDGWPEWILDKVGIETALVNMPSLGPGQKSRRFRWVPTANSLLFPFGGVEANPEIGTVRLPATLDDYSRDVIGSTLTRWRGEGAVAIKLSTAYDRSLDFADVAAAEASRIYAAQVQTSTAPAAADYKALQDYLFRVLAREAGRAGLAVHIHVGIGADPWFAIAGANPLLLEPALNDKTLRSTCFVLVHGGWPFQNQAGVMLIKPNLYADFSAQTFLRSPRALSETLRAWLEWYPEKVLFGTDAYSDPNTPASDWEEMLWLANDSARQALAIALTGMMNDGQITRARALELAKMVLRENAMKLYALD